MKQQPRIYYTETDKAVMWDRWQKRSFADTKKPALGGAFLILISRSDLLSASR